jgi:hypothetical protein
MLIHNACLQAKQMQRQRDIEKKEAELSQYRSKHQDKIREINAIEADFQEMQVFLIDQQFIKIVIIMFMTSLFPTNQERNS